VFGHRAASARKLNVRKLSHLLSPRILNLSKVVVNVNFDRGGRERRFSVLTMAIFEYVTAKGVFLNDTHGS